MSQKQKAVEEIPKKTNFKKSKRNFEKSGLVNPNISYHVFLEKVANKDNQDVKTMVDHGRYFSIFAPRQSGKTTFFRDFCRQLEKDSRYIAIRLNFESSSSLSIETFYQQIEKEFHTQLLDRLTAVHCQQLSSVKKFLESHPLSNHISFEEFFEGLNRIIQFKKIVIFIDEFDGIPLQELKNFLTSLRKLYQKYKEVNNKALYSIGLVGIRDITQLIVGGVSPFNIADEISIPPFSLDDIRELYSQYTHETNQPFAEETIEKVHQMTGGQPWLVNRMGTILTKNIKPETTETITDQDVDEAINLLLREKNNHFTNLWEKLEGNEKTFIDIASKEIPYSPYEKGQSWLSQYGLIKDENGKAVVANPIYRKLFLPVLKKIHSSSISSPSVSNSDSESSNEVFVSYAWGKESDELIQQLEKAFQEKGICVILDKRNLGFKGKIQDFMKRIGKGKCVVAIIGKQYLESENCMFELIQMAKNKSFYDRIFPIVLPNAKIYKSSSRIEYVEYWEEEIKTLDTKLKKVSSANLQGFREDIDRYQEIRNTIAELMSLLRDMNTLTPETHKETEFQEIIQSIEEKLNS